MKDLMDYILKNKYVIICVAIIALLYFLGIVEFITQFVIFLVLIIFAVFIGKTLQDNNGKINNIFDNIFKKKNSEVYYYQEEKKTKEKNKKEK